MPVAEAVELMRGNAGPQFDPAVLDCLIAALPELVAVRSEHADERFAQRLALALAEAV